MLPVSGAEKLVHAFMTSRLDYCNALLAGCPASSINKLQPRCTMRFVVLALAVLLAGCQAQLTWEELFSQLEHVKSTFQVYADQLKQVAYKALTHLDDTEFKDYKEFLGLYVDDLHGYLQNSFQAISPFVAYMLVATAPMREEMHKEVEDLRKKIKPMREELRQVLEKHFQEYRDELKPFLEENLAKQRKLMEEVRTKLEPLVKSLKEKIGTNWEETKSKLTPIMEAVRKKVVKHLQDLKTLLEPYMQDYRDQIEKGVLELRQSVKSGELRKKMNELGEEVKPHFQAIFTDVRKAFYKE